MASELTPSFHGDQGLNVITPSIVISGEDADADGETDEELTHNPEAHEDSLVCNKHKLEEEDRGRAKEVAQQPWAPQHPKPESGEHPPTAPVLENPLYHEQLNLLNQLMGSNFDEWFTGWVRDHIKYSMAQGQNLDDSITKLFLAIVDILEDLQIEMVSTIQGAVYPSDTIETRLSVGKFREFRKLLSSNTEHARNTLKALRASSTSKTVTTLSGRVSRPPQMALSTIRNPPKRPAQGGKQRRNPAPMKQTSEKIKSKAADDSSDSVSEYKPTSSNGSTPPKPKSKRQKRATTTTTVASSALVQSGRHAAVHAYEGPDPVPSSAPGTDADEQSEVKSTIHNAPASIGKNRGSGLKLAKETNANTQAPHALQAGNLYGIMQDGSETRSGTSIQSREPLAAPVPRPMITGISALRAYNPSLSSLRSGLNYYTAGTTEQNHGPRSYPSFYPDAAGYRYSDIDTFPPAVQNPCPSSLPTYSYYMPEYSSDHVNDWPSLTGPSTSGTPSTDHTRDQDYLTGARSTSYGGSYANEVPYVPLSDFDPTRHAYPSLDSSRYPSSSTTTVGTNTTQTHTGFIPRLPTTNVSGFPALHVSASQTALSRAPSVNLGVSSQVQSPQPSYPARSMYNPQTTSGTSLDPGTSASQATGMAPRKTMTVSRANPMNGQSAERLGRVRDWVGNVESQRGNHS